MSFLPKDYELPKQQGLYMKLEQGENKFRILSEAITGYEYWTADNKPVRIKDYPKSLPADIRKDSKIKHFWAFIVWNYKTGSVQILELTQSTIQGAINDLITTAEWGEPTEYDIVVKRKGESLETEYSTMPWPKKPLADEAKQAYEESEIKLDALFEGKDPASSDETEINPDDSPF